MTVYRCFQCNRKMLPCSYNELEVYCRWCKIQRPRRDGDNVKLIDTVNFHDLDHFDTTISPALRRALKQKLRNQLHYGTSKRRKYRYRLLWKKQWMVTMNIIDEPRISRQITVAMYGLRDTIIFAIDGCFAGLIARKIHGYNLDMLNSIIDTFINEIVPLFFIVCDELSDSMTTVILDSGDRYATRIIMNRFVDRIIPSTITATLIHDVSELKGWL